MLHLTKLSIVGVGDHDALCKLVVAASKLPRLRAFDMRGRRIDDYQFASRCPLLLKMTSLQTLGVPIMEIQDMLGVDDSEEVGSEDDGEEELEYRLTSRLRELLRMLCIEYKDDC